MASTPVFTSETRLSWQYPYAALITEGDTIYFLGDYYSVTNVSRTGQDVIIEGESRMYRTVHRLYFSRYDKVAATI